MVSREDQTGSDQKGPVQTCPDRSIPVQTGPELTGLLPLWFVRTLWLRKRETPRGPQAAAPGRRSTGGEQSEEPGYSEEEAELYEEVARYEEEKYHPEEQKKGNKKLLPRQSSTAPPPYEARSCAFSLVPDRVRRKLRMTFPVFETQEGERVHAPVKYSQIKELAESVRKYGVTANFTLTILERLALNYLTPSDWQMIAKATLVNMGQYMELKVLWYEAAQTQARANATALTPEQREWTFELLTGQGRFSADQANYHWGVYIQVSSSAIKAWKALTRKGGADNQLTHIIQGPQEPFSDFVARMTETAGRIFGDAEQAAPLIEQLVYEQATQECYSTQKKQRITGLAQSLQRTRAWGKPRCVKTDNGPAYTSQKFRQFCAQMQVTHLTGLPYNPQGQGIIERAHRTLKSYLIKQRGGIMIELPPTPRVATALALFTLNFLNLDEAGQTAAENWTSDFEQTLRELRAAIIQARLYLAVLSGLVYPKSKQAVTSDQKSWSYCGPPRGSISGLGCALVRPGPHCPGATRWHLRCPFREAPVASRGSQKLFMYSLKSSVIIMRCDFKSKSCFPDVLGCPVFALVESAGAEKASAILSDLAFQVGRSGSQHQLVVADVIAALYIHILASMIYPLLY
eukprot:XP_017457682.1 PREDICTED: igE-binding protein-like [Rattus norvegicus]